MPRGFDKEDRILIDRGRLHQRLQNGAQIADGNLLAEQLLQHFLHFSERHQFRDQLIHQLRVRVGKPINQALRLLRVSADRERSV